MTTLNVSHMWFGYQILAAIFPLLLNGLLTSSVAHGQQADQVIAQYVSDLGELKQGVAFATLKFDYLGHEPEQDGSRAIKSDVRQEGSFDLRFAFNAETGRMRFMKRKSGVSEDQFFSQFLRTEDRLYIWEEEKYLFVRPPDFANWHYLNFVDFRSLGLNSYAALSKGILGRDWEGVVASMSKQTFWKCSVSGKETILWHEAIMPAHESGRPELLTRVEIVFSKDSGNMPTRVTHLHLPKSKVGTREMYKDDEMVVDWKEKSGIFLPVEARTSKESPFGTSSYEWKIEWTSVNEPAIADEYLDRSSLGITSKTTEVDYRLGTAVVVDDSSSPIPKLQEPTKSFSYLWGACTVVAIALLSVVGYLRRARPTPLQ